MFLVILGFSGLFCYGRRLLSQDDGYSLSSILAKVELMASSRCSAVLHLLGRASSFMTVVVLTELLWSELKCSIIPLFVLSVWMARSRGSCIGRKQIKLLRFT